MEDVDTVAALTENERRRGGSLAQRESLRGSRGVSVDAVARSPRVSDGAAVSAQPHRSRVGTAASTPECEHRRAEHHRAALQQLITLSAQKRAAFGTPVTLVVPKTD